MQACLVFESMFGNTRDLAEAVADGFRQARPDVPITLVNVLDAPTDPGADLLIVGGPTHTFTMSRPETRADRDKHATTDEARAAVAALPGADTGPGVREWLATLVPSAGTLAAAFDTRVNRPFPKRAAKAMAKQLTGLGYRLATPPEGFEVTGMTGPLADGELDRARAWGAQLAATLPA